MEGLLQGHQVKQIVKSLVKDVAAVLLKGL